MVWSILGWIAWGIAALFTLGQWEYKFRHPDGGVRILAGRCAFLFTCALVFTAVTPVSRLHLLWVCPVLYMGSSLLTTIFMQANMASALARMEEESRRTGEPLADVMQRETTRLQASGNVRDYTPQERAEIEDLLASGDREGATARIAKYQADVREELKEQGVDIEHFVAEIGRDIAWSDVVRQVFRVLELNRGTTTIGEDGMPKNSKLTTPYGYLLVESPIFNYPARLPIVHRDDFLLATFVYDSPQCDQLLEEAELLVTYAPKRTLRDGKSASVMHCLHYVLCPQGTLDRYYAFNDDLHMRIPDTGKLFGKFVYSGKIRVEVNQNPAL